MAIDAASKIDSSLGETMFESFKDSQAFDAFWYDYDLLPSFMLTTVDNPFNPFEDFDGWYQWDEAHGYCTCGLLARYCKASIGLSERDQQISTALAVDAILSEDPFGFYMLVAKPKASNK